MFVNVNKFFYEEERFGEVPTIGTQPNWKRQLLAIRPVFKEEGFTLILRCVPNRSLVLKVATSLLFERELKVEELKSFASILPLFILNQKEFDLKIIEFVRGLILINHKIKRSEIWNKVKKIEANLSFIPSKALAGLKEEAKLETNRVWIPKKVVIFPQRKRGYDDKGSLPPVDAISWRELASNLSLRDLSFDEEHLLKPSGIWQYAVDAATDESQLVDEIPILGEFL